MIRLRRATLALAAVSCACASDNPAALDATCTDETGIVRVTVAARLAPVIDWAPACPVAFLSIDDGLDDKWAIATDTATWADAAQANLIMPPVTYGVAPTSASQLVPPGALVSLDVYQVNVARVLPAGSTAECFASVPRLCVMEIHLFTAVSDGGGQ